MENKQQPPYPLRMPDDLRTRLEADAKRLGRSLNSEIVSRLQESLWGEKDLDIRAEIEKLRTENGHLGLVADLADSYRSLTGAMLVSALDVLPPDQWPVHIGGHALEMLAERDERGALFSILGLLDGSEQETVEKLRDFAGHLEDEGLDTVSMVTRLRESLAANRAKRAQEKAAQTSESMPVKKPRTRSTRVR